MKGFKTELYFGTHIKDGTFVTEEDFQQFLAEVVDNKFPGYNISQVTGRYTYEDGTPVMEPTYVLETIVPHNEYEQAAMHVDLIVQEYKTRFKQESVLLSTGLVTYDFLG